MHLSKFHPNPMTPTEVINRFQLKEHLYTFELPPKRNMSPIKLIFTGLIQDTLAMLSTKFHSNQMTLVRVTLDFRLKERKSTFEIPADSKSTYIPLSCHQNAIPLRLSSYSQGRITIHSPYPLPNFIQIHQHPLKLLTDSNSKSTYIPLSRYQSAIPSDWAHFHRDKSGHTRHVPYQISSKSNDPHWSY